MTKKELSHRLTNYVEFAEGIQKLEILPRSDGSYFHFTEETTRSWYDLFSHYPIALFQKTVTYWLDQKDHFPVPTELKLAIQALQASQSAPTRSQIMKSLPPTKNYSQEYQDANQKYFKALNAWIKKPIPEAFETLQQETTSILQDFSYLPSCYSCSTCWDSGLTQTKESIYFISYACSCQSGLKHQQANFWATVKKYLPKNLVSNNPFDLLKHHQLIAGIIQGKRFYCHSALSPEGRTDYQCQKNCLPPKLAFCQGNIDEIKKALTLNPLTAVLTWKP